MPIHPTQHPRIAVTTDGTRVDGFEAPAFVPTRLLVHHYVTKSRQDYAEKMARGDGMGMRQRKADYWDRVQQL